MRFDLVMSLCYVNPSLRTWLTDGVTSESLARSSKFLTLKLDTLGHEFRQRVETHPIALHFPDFNSSTMSFQVSENVGEAALGRLLPVSGSLAWGQCMS